MSSSTHASPSWQHSWLEWPFLDDGHRQLAPALQAWCEQHLQTVDENDLNAACRSLVQKLGQVPGKSQAHCTGLSRVQLAALLAAQWVRGFLRQALLCLKPSGECRWHTLKPFATSYDRHMCLTNTR